MEKNEKPENSRRKFLKSFGAGVGAASLAGAGMLAGSSAYASSGSKVKVLTSDGKLVEVDKEALSEVKPDKDELRDLAREGLPNRKFVMVIDLSKCANARKCVDACQEGHMLPKDHEWIKLYSLQDAEHTSPYWLPRPCFHCDNPLCVSVCPVGATYKRDDGIVLVDTKRCIGCKFCMTGCPYSARVFNWQDPEVEVPEDHVYDPELNVPPVEGTVGKCLFCADKLRKNELPRCVTACPMGALYFGDLVEDAVTNGVETIRFSKTMEEKHGYRYLESLGTHPSVYYLPPTNRLFPYKNGMEGLDEAMKERYKDAGPREGKSKIN
ncbi:MAG: 4Fe-4S dicluster domain-containing protein [Marinilabiliaceae bacterium]|jgi:molybdopterin-containing oxidoreductase family iron-sulfur binding subunit|nr:4Fe-4S dicluster domain-containing protein [Marinilabiliaceae bacterium]